MPAALSRFHWYLRRIAAMSPAEVAFRICELIKRSYSRFRLPDFAELSRDVTQVPIIPGFLGRVRELAANHPEVLADWRETARQVTAGRFTLLGFDWPLQAGAPDWHLDPVTSLRWPTDKYSFDISYRRKLTMGDVKYVWELNRLQYLQSIAALAAVTGDTKLVALCSDHLRSWIDANHPMRGIHWTSGIELALRTVSIEIICSLIGETFDESLRRKVIYTLTAHGYWLQRFPSRYSSANNHLVAEACALYLLGLHMPLLGVAENWRTGGRRILEREVLRQFTPDGVGVEQSPAYAAFVVEWFLLAKRSGDLFDEPFPLHYENRLAAAGDFLQALTDCGQHLPRIGDDDEGRVFFDNRPSHEYIQSVRAALSASVGRPDVAPRRAAPHLRHALLGRTQDGPLPLTGVRHFGSGGYTVGRAVDRGLETLWVMDHGPIGYLSLAAHGHADTLAVWLHVDGKPVLVDSGTFMYHAGGTWRDYFRSTPAHNTLTVGGADSSQMTGDFMWGRRAHAVVREFRNDGPLWSIEAEHDGYQAATGVIHRRRLEREDVSAYRLVDWLVGRVGQKVEIGFIISPDLELSGGGDCWEVTVSAGVSVRIEGDGRLQARVEHGVHQPLRGWYSPRFGQKVPSTRLVFGGWLPPATPASFLISVVGTTLGAIASDL